MKLAEFMEETRLDFIRDGLVKAYGGMGPGSPVWSNTQWDKGYVAGIRAAITAFDTCRGASVPANDPAGSQAASRDAKKE
jgi:hypothetical protein